MTTCWRRRRRSCHNAGRRRLLTPRSTTPLTLTSSGGHRQSDNTKRRRSVTKTTRDQRRTMRWCRRSRSNSTIGRRRSRMSSARLGGGRRRRRRIRLVRSVDNRTLPLRTASFDVIEINRFVLLAPLGAPTVGQRLGEDARRARRFAGAVAVTAWDMNRDRNGANCRSFVDSAGRGRVARRGRRGWRCRG